MTRSARLKSYVAENKLLNLIQNYLTNLQQIVLLDGQISKWTNILAGISQCSVLGPLLFLIYTNDLPDGLKLICKISADDTSPFSKIEDIDTSNIDIKNHLVTISRWDYQWDMSFSPDTNKQVTIVYFSQRRKQFLSLPIKALNSQSRGPVFKTIGWLQGRLSLSSFRGR